MKAERGRTASIAAAIVVALALSFGFLEATRLRVPVNGKYPDRGDNLWRINASFALSAARNWYRDGIVSSGGRVVFWTGSVESPGTGSLYFSYPPAFVLWPALRARLLGRAPEIADVNAAGAAFHWLCVVLVGLTAFSLARACGGGAAASALLGIASGGPALFLPAALVFFPFGWWADIAGLPFFAALLFLETIEPEWGRSRWFRASRLAVIVGGVVSDWLFWLLLAAIAVRNLTRRRGGEAAPFRTYARSLPSEILAPAAYLALHLLLVLRAGYLRTFADKIAERTGMARAEIPFAEGLARWQASLWSWLGAGAPALFWVSFAVTALVAALFWNRSRLARAQRRWAELAFLALVPVYLHCLILHQHYYNHGYNTAKLALVYPLFWLGLVPASAFLRWRAAAPQLAVAALALAISAKVSLDARASSAEHLTRPLDLPSREQAFCEDVFRHSAPGDIIVSPDLATLDPARLWHAPLLPRVNQFARSACGRSVYLALHPSDIAVLFVRSGWLGTLIGKDYKFWLYTFGAPAAEWRPYLVPGNERVAGGIEAHQVSPGVIDAGL